MCGLQNRTTMRISGCWRSSCRDSMRIQMQYSPTVDHGASQAKVSWLVLPTTSILTSIQKSGQQIFGPTDAKNAKNTSSIETPFLMQVQCCFGGMCINGWAALMSAWFSAVIGKHGFPWP